MRYYKTRISFSKLGRSVVQSNLKTKRNPDRWPTRIIQLAGEERIALVLIISKQKICRKY